MLGPPAGAPPAPCLYIPASPSGFGPPTFTIYPPDLFSLIVSFCRCENTGKRPIGPCNGFVSLTCYRPAVYIVISWRPHPASIVSVVSTGGACAGRFTCPPPSSRTRPDLPAGQRDSLRAAALAGRAVRCGSALSPDYIGQAGARLIHDLLTAFLVGLGFPCPRPCRLSCQTKLLSLLRLGRIRKRHTQKHQTLGATT